MRIAIFGASVSAQSVNHKTGEITGYSEVLRLRHSAELGTTPSEIRRFTYPGNRLSDGGLMRLSDVVAFKPRICLVEPLIEDKARGIDVTDDEIAFIYATLIEVGILPVTVMLPMPREREVKNHYAFARYNAFCKQHGLPVVQVDLSHVGTLDGRFEGPHTRNAGARIYATQIVARLKQLDAPEVYLARLEDFPKSSDIPVALTRLKMDTNLPFRQMQFRLGAARPGVTRARLVQQQRIGPFSPVLDVITRTRIVPDTAPIHQKISLWDLHCHYERHSFVTLAHIMLDGLSEVYVDIRQSDNDPDYATCRREVSDWPALSEREMRPLGMPVLISDGPVKVGQIRTKHF